MKIAILRYWGFYHVKFDFIRIWYKKKWISQCYNDTNIMPEPFNSLQTKVKRGCS